jgi:hypothetical protein
MSRNSVINESGGAIVALFTLLLMWVCYYFGTAALMHDYLLSGFIFSVLGFCIVAVIFPSFFVINILDEGCEGIGFSWKSSKRAVLVSLLVCTEISIRQLPSVWDELTSMRGSEIFRQFIFNALILWEPFFIHSWLQIRFAKAYGCIIGALLAAAGCTLYHVFTLNIDWLSIIFVRTLLSTIAFEIGGRNILVVFPLVWMLGSGIGTLEIGYKFEWVHIGSALLFLIVQLYFIYRCARRRERRIHNIY